MYLINCPLSKDTRVPLALMLQYVEDNLAVMSIGFLLGSPDDAVIWRGPKKNGTKHCIWSGGGGLKSLEWGSQK